MVLWSSVVMSGLFAGAAINILTEHIPRILQQNWRQQCWILHNGNDTSSCYLSKKKLRLHCLNCDMQLPVWMNLPLFPRLMKLRKCAHCNQQLVKHYVWVELGVSIVTLVITRHFGIHAETFVILVLIWGLILLALIDSKYYLLPDCITLTLIWLGLLSNVGGLFVAPEQAILGAAVGYLSLRVIGVLYKLIRKAEGIGHGDYKLLSVFGAWLGVYPLPMIMFLASMIGLIVVIMLMLRGRHSYDMPLPFGPYLVAAGLSVLLFGKFNIFF